MVRRDNKIIIETIKIFQLLNDIKANLKPDLMHDETGS